MSGSVKGRVILSRVPVVRRGTCAWCGETVFGRDGVTHRCPRCGSEEIDWIPLAPPIAALPEPAIPKPADRLRLDDNTLRIGAMQLQGARVYGRR